MRSPAHCVQGLWRRGRERLRWKIPEGGPYEPVEQTGK
jgi:hypothetical protein